MNHSPKLLLSLLATALATGCASQATLVVHSEPQGAYISDDTGRLLGTTPLEIQYPFDGNSASCVETGNFTAHWVSGVEEEVRSLLLCEPGYASTRINRDLSQPGLAEDREFALQLEMLQLQQAQTVAAQQAADAAWAEAAALRDAAYAARWSRGRNRDYDRDYDRDDRECDGRDYDRDRDDRERGERDYDGDGEQPRREGAYRAPAAPTTNQDNVGDTSVVIADTNPGNIDLNDPAALQAEYVRVEQAAAETETAQAVVEQAPAEEAPVEQQAPAEEPAPVAEEIVAQVEPGTVEE